MSLRRRLNKNPELCKNYYDIFKEYESSKIIERVPTDEASEPGKVHYLPHRAVIRQDKVTTKVRPVFDASAKVSGPSLNDCLYAGPNLLSLIYDILLRFRTHKIALISDIKQAFLNIEVHPNHVDYLRFLWFANGLLTDFSEFCLA